MCFSAFASIWEIIVKAQRGRLPLSAQPATQPTVDGRCGKTWVEVTFDCAGVYVFKSRSLPCITETAFDRIMLAKRSRNEFRS